MFAFYSYVSLPVYPKTIHKRAFVDQTWRAPGCLAGPFLGSTDWSCELGVLDPVLPSVVFYVITIPVGALSLPVENWGGNTYMVCGTLPLLYIRQKLQAKSRLLGDRSHPVVHQISRFPAYLDIPTDRKWFVTLVIVSPGLVGYPISMDELWLWTSY